MARESVLQYEELYCNEASKWTVGIVLQYN